MVKYALCGSDNVKLLTGISSLNDISTSDITNYMNQAERKVYKTYNPLFRSKIYINEQAIEAGSLAMKFVPDYADYDVYYVGSITLNGSLIGSENYSELLDDGKILFNGSSLFSGKNGYLLGIEFIPYTYKDLAELYAAKYILDDMSLITASDANIARADRINARINDYKTNLRPKGALFTSSGNGVRLGAHVYTIKNPFDEIEWY